MFGGDQMKCVEPACVPANSVCGGPGQLTQECCGNAVCQTLFGGTQMKCVEPTPQSCVPANSVCGGPGQLTQECCGNAICQTFLGGDQMQCVEPAPQSLRGSKLSVAHANSTLPPPAAVQTMAAPSSSGVDSSTLAVAAAESQCVPANNVCGGSGQLTQECCGNAVCQKMFGGDQMKCVEPACVPANGVC